MDAITFIDLAIAFIDLAIAIAISANAFVISEFAFMDLVIAIVILVFAIAVSAIKNVAEQVSVCVRMSVNSKYALVYPAAGIATYFKAVRSCCSNTTLKISVKLTLGMSRHKTCR
jgi:hypothetical protein